MKMLCVLLMAGATVFAADKPTIAQMNDGQLTMVEREMVPLAEAMPADKYGFAPKQGAFKDARTFGEQVKHVAAVIYLVAAATLEEQPPVDTGGEKGPAGVASKEEIVQFLKGSFAYAHRALAKLNAENQLDMVKSPFGDGTTPRAAIAAAAVWHTFDHYGQMAVYARMNNLVPPASR